MQQMSQYYSTEEKQQIIDAYKSEYKDKLNSLADTNIKLLKYNNLYANADWLFTPKAKNFLIDRFMISYELNTEYDAVKTVCHNLSKEDNITPGYFDYDAVKTVCHNLSKEDNITPGYFDSNVVKLMVIKETDSIKTTPDNILKKLVAVRTGLERYIMDLKSFIQKEQSLHSDQAFEGLQTFVQKEDNELKIFTEVLDRIEKDVNILSPEGIKYKYPNGIEAELYSQYNSTINLKDDVEPPQTLNTEHTSEDVIEER